MQNSDSGTKLNPGDRVRIKLNPRRDHSYSAEQNQARQALAGQEGSIRERTVTNAYRVAPPGSTERGAWFEADELGPVDAAPLDVLDAAVQQALAAARREAQGWHSAALLARGEAEGAWAHVRSVEAGLDALRGKLGAAEAKLRETKGHLAAREGALADERGKLAAVRAAWSEAQDAWRSGDAARRHRAVEAVDKALGGVEVAEHPLAALRRASFDNVRAVLVGLGATVEADNRAGSFTATLPAAVPIEALMWLQSTLAETLPGDVCLVVKGPALAEQKAGPAWATEGDPWRAEIEARLGRLESGEALAKMLEAAATLKVCGAIGPSGRRCVRGAGHDEPDLHGDLFVSWGKRP